MNLSDLKPCQSCGGPLLTQGSIQFYVVELDQAIVTPAINQTLGLAQMMGGSMALAEAFQPREPVAMLSENGAPKTKAMICFDCYCKPLSLASLMEKVNNMEAGDGE